jgi:predicted dehydrogenase
MVVSALEAGKHVVCEKPFALSAADCDRMLAAAERAGRLLTVYQSRRWDSDFVAMRDAVAAGSIGEPFYMEAFIGGFSHPCSYWHSHEPISGGTIFDWGSHYFDWVLQLFGQPVASVTAQQHKRVWHDVTNADQVRVDLLFEGGAQASFLQSDIAAALKPKWYLLGTAGALLGEWRLEKVSSRAWTGDLVEETLAPSEAPARVFVQRPGPDGGSGREELALPRRIENGFYRNLGDHLLAGEALAVTATQARRTVAVMEAATRSIAEGGRQVEAAF